MTVCGHWGSPGLAGDFWFVALFKLGGIMEKKKIRKKSNPTTFFYGTIKGFRPGAFIIPPIGVFDVSYDSYDGPPTVLFVSKFRKISQGGSYAPLFLGGTPSKPYSS